VNRTLVVAVALALAFPATAAAKEIAAVKVCGASGCRDLSKAVVDRIGEGSNGETFAPAPPLQPFYRLVYTVKAAPGETFGDGKTESTYTSWYVPGAHVTQSVDEAGYIVWYPVTREFADALAKLTAHLRPNAAPKLTSVRVDGRDVELTDQEFRLLHLLATHAGIVFSREALLSRVWKDQTFVTVRSVDTLVKRLRRRIEPTPGRPKFLLTVWGVGYKFADV
jgi:hypothetical protein